MDLTTVATILQILQAHPWLGLFVVLTGAFAGGAWKAAVVLVDRLLERRGSDRGGRPNIRQHPFFSAVAHAIRSRVQGLDIPEPFREKVFKDFLLIKFSVWLAETEALVTRVTGDPGMSQEAFHCKVLAYVDTLVERYEAQAKLQGIPDAVVVRFREWHGGNVDLTLDFLQRVSDSRWYPTAEDRLHAVLSFMVSMLDHTLMDAEAMLSGLNGELDGIRYAGLISHCKYGNKCAACTNPARLGSESSENANDTANDG